MVAVAGAHVDGITRVTIRQFFGRFLIQSVDAEIWHGPSGSTPKFGVDVFYLFYKLL